MTVVIKYNDKEFNIRNSPVSNKSLSKLAHLLNVGIQIDKSI